MAILCVQLPHPGKQKPFSLLNGYRNVEGKNIREWNNDSPKHYRKFLKNNGEYINNISDPNSKNAELFFWGEWEGNSFFTPFESNKNMDHRILPNGYHEPFHSIKIRGNQNTDPYVYGEFFKYSICKQQGQMKKLDPNSLIIFGSVFPSLKKFYIDTVFVIKDYEISINVQATGGNGYSQVYIEETLEQLEQYLGSTRSVNDHKIYHSQTWWDNKEYFSFVPCKLNHEGKGFERLFIDLYDPEFNLSSYPSGKSFFGKCVYSSPEKLWRKIVEIAIKQDFMLGIQFAEPDH